jgi:uncharacterized protein (DUF433 family)
MVGVIQEHIEIVQGAGGPKARIAGHRVRVLDIAVMHEKFGLSVDEIVDQIPTITRADVYAALAYYWDHREEIEEAIVEEEAVAEAMRRARGLGPLEEKLRRMRNG